MEPFARNLGELLRYVLAGGVFMLSLALLQDGPGPQSAYDVRGLTLSSPTVAALAASLIGALLYLVHRGIVYPLFDWLIALAAERSPKRACARIRRNDDQRWRRARTDHPFHHAQEGLSHWGDLVHFGYCSWLAILASWFLAGALGVDRGPVESWITWVSFAVVLFATICTNRRLLARDSWYAGRGARRLSGGTPSTPPTGGGCAVNERTSE